MGTDTSTKSPPSNELYLLEHLWRSGPAHSYPALSQPLSSSLSSSSGSRAASRAAHRTTHVVTGGIRVVSAGWPRVVLVLRLTHHLRMPRESSEALATELDSVPTEPLVSISGYSARVP